MDPELLAAIGLSRLRLPIPMAKFQIVHAAARSLRDTETSEATWNALLNWVAALDLESELLEALCILVCARGSTTLNIGALRSVIRCPSILSDVFISEAFDTPILVNSWINSHSGEAPHLYRADELAVDLSKGYIVPPILGTRIKKLEDSTHKPFFKQWVYEFDRLQTMLGSPSDGHFSYFSGDERDRSVGQFIARKGHFGRSAYLRTLALAVDLWGVPEEIARSEAMHATPADFSFLKIAPSDPPEWAMLFHQAQPGAVAEWKEALNEVAKEAYLSDVSRQLLHFNASARPDKRYQAEVELIAVLSSGENLPIEKVFRIHSWLLGRIYIARTTDWKFAINGCEPDATFPLDGNVQMLPALYPAVGHFVGYFHSDLIGRMPYLPANYSQNAALKAHPRIGGADIELNEKNVGEFRYWNWRWAPMHDKDLGTHCAVSVTLSEELIDELLQVPGMRCTRVWKATVLTRDSDYGDWKKSVHFGTLPFL